jgi:S-adenosyl-L-methionine hydrolase (adenosine-forming)
MPCLTLLSDLGTNDPSVAVVKGILLQHTHDLPIIDISHEARPFNTRQTAYLLRCAYRSFPSGSIHLVLSDIFSGRSPRVLLAEDSGQYIICADNGITPLALGPQRKIWLYKELEQHHTFIDWVHNASSLAADILANNGITATLQEHIPRSIPTPDDPQQSNNTVKCAVLHVDQFENVILDITKDDFNRMRAGRNFTIQFMQTEEITEISNGYTDVRAGYKLCRFNSSGFLEICINRGNAASLFGIRLGSEQNDIKIVFE